MLDLKFIVENIDEVIEKLSTRGGDFSFVRKVVPLAEKRKAIIAKVEILKAKRNEVSRLIGEYKRQKKNTKELFEEIDGCGNEIKALDDDLALVNEKIQAILEATPNIPDETTPFGKGEKDNVVIKTHLRPTQFNFVPKDHVELGEKLGIIDFESAAKITGARFAVLKGLGARLERALVSFMMDLHTDNHKYSEILPPFIINENSLYTTGQFPKFVDDVFKVLDNGWYLNPTAEVPTINIYRNDIIDADKLPISLASFTTAFRSEAGAAGRDTKGLLRQHQFNKVELIKICRPEQSNDEHEKMLSDSMKVLDYLKLPYRVVVLCTYDLGFVMKKTYDIEVWLPGQNTYREIASISNAGDYQARRGNIRFKQSKDAKTEYVHTLNGSGLAIGRTLIAILENYQNEDGTITIPQVLIPYMRKKAINFKDQES